MKKYIPFTSVIFLFFATSLFGQQHILDGWHYIEVDSTKQMWGDWDEPDWLRYFGLDAGDVDRDGNLDIVSGRYIYHNPGGAMEGHWKRTVLDDNVDGILYMDVDGDPYVDIIAMALPNLYWYEAIDAEGTRYRRMKIGEVPATSHVNSQGFEKAQIIAGGLQEFVIAGNGDIYAVEIPKEKPDTESWKVNMICKNTSDEGIGVGDIDGDGDLDIAAGRRPDGEEEPKILVWYENPGNIDSLWEPTVVGESIHPIDRVEIADINDDTKADIIVTEERYPGLEPDANFWWFGQQSLDVWKRNKIATQYSINNLDSTDFDKDGDTDLLTAEHKGQALELQLWKNDGTGNFSKTVIDTGKENHLGTQFFDLDNDGDLDIIGAGWDNHKFMHVWRNDEIKSLKTGMLFKDYPWVPTMTGDDGKFLRVGGKYGYAVNEDHFPKKKLKNGAIPLDLEVDLTDAVAAEVIVERVQSHEDTKDLRIQFNDGEKNRLPEPPIIRDTATNYMFHTNIRIPIKINDLKQGAENVFRLTVATEQSWNWPQNLIYGVVLRVYYNENKRELPVMKISGISNGDNLEETVKLSVKGGSTDEIAKVDYIGLYEDINYQGDGKYRQWQYRYHRGKRQNHIGSSSKAPFEVVWDTEWLPNQKRPISISALATDRNGFTQFLPSIEGLVLDREHSISLFKPYGQEPFWTTRNGEHTEYLEIPLEIPGSETAKLYWNSWSPCYSEGLELNGSIQNAEAETPCYDAYLHDEKLQNITALKQGKNVLKTLKTPLQDGQMVHGMDVQWPGIMLKMKKERSSEDSIHIVEGTHESRPHYIVHTEKVTYYFDKAGGGFSRIIDKYGNDWVNFKMEPWDQYPASAASAFRGLPNLVFKSDTDSGAGHPGHDRCVSKSISSNIIHTKTESGLWEWQWTFFDEHAVLEILKTEENMPYWFLYEGTPGGTYAPKASSYGTSSGGYTKEVPDFYQGNVHYGKFDWAYFTQKDCDTTFFLAQITPDDHVDMMSYLGDTDKGAFSDNGMVVFGFGRGENTEPLLNTKNTFVVGMADFPVTNNQEHQKVAQYIRRLTPNTRK